MNSTGDGVDLTGYIHRGHISYMVTRASVHHGTPPNVLIPLKDVMCGRDLEMFACPPHHPRTWHKRMDFLGAV